MKVFCAGIATETNTFAPVPTTLKDFYIIRTAELHAEEPEIEGVREIILAFLEKTKERGWTFDFSLYAVAEPSGTTVRAAYENMRDEILHDLKAAMPVDAVLLPLHGAMVADGYDDCEGDLIARIREIVGPDVKIGVELDLHCHLTHLMVEKSDAIVLFKEYPHTDMLDRAADLFEIVADSVEAKITPTMALYDCRMISFFLTSFEPMRSFVDHMLALEGKDGVLSVSFAHCFPWGDVPECGARMLVITDNNPYKAAELAEELGQQLFNMRNEVILKPLSLDAAFDKALSIPPSNKPVVIADQADNAGGGAPSDSTFALRAMLERGITDAGIALFWDPIVVQIAMAVGPGARLNIRLGGKMGPTSGDPLDLTVTVIGVIEDMYQEFPQTDRMIPSSCGDSVALHCNGIDIIVNSIRTQVFSPKVFTNFGIDIAQKRLLVVKSTQHFYAGYKSIASEIIYMAAPGAISPIFTEIPFTRVDLNKFPWVDDPFGDG
jgi:microcystin degradation protein MlrC